MSRTAAFVRTITDDVGITDPITAPKSIAQSVTDDVGLTDSTSNVKSIVQTITDITGITDAVSRVATFVRTITDTLGITDPVSVVAAEATYTFTPGTYNQAITGKEEHTLSRDHVSMWRHYGGMIPVGYSVLITDGVATASPGRVSPSIDNIKDADSGSGDDGRAVFTRGSTYTITSSERTILLAAGYTIT